MVLLGCENVFKDVPAVVETLLCIAVNESQVYRACQAVSLQIVDDQLERPSQELLKIENKCQKQVYGMIDGSMLPTDEGWQETKVGRVFEADLIAHSQPFKWEMGKSEYVAHRGHYIEFTEKFERLLAPNSACQKIFITDGALWIGKWLSETYPTAIHILDYFHVCEKLAIAAQADKNPEKWLKNQKDNLLDGKHKKVCKAVRLLHDFDAESKEKLLNYLNNNKYRMKYNEYRQKDLMISSGPIESAHRTVLQVRMKRSGQHWSEHGCDNMIKLRVAYRSEKFRLITDILRNQAA